MKAAKAISRWHFRSAATIGKIAASLALLAGPAWGLADQPQAADTDRQVVKEPVQTTDIDRQRVQEQAQMSQEQAQEQKALSQQPNPSPDSKLYMEIYTDKNFSK